MFCLVIFRRVEKNWVDLLLGATTSWRNKQLCEQDLWPVTGNKQITPAIGVALSLQSIVEALILPYSLLEISGPKGKKNCFEYVMDCNGTRHFRYARAGFKVWSPMTPEHFDCPTFSGDHLFATKSHDLIPMSCGTRQCWSYLFVFFIVDSSIICSVVFNMCDGWLMGLGELYKRERSILHLSLYLDF